MVWVVGGEPAVLTGSTLISDYVSTRPLNASFFLLLQGKLRNTELAKVQISGHLIYYDPGAFKTTAAAFNLDYNL